MRPVVTLCMLLLVVGPALLAPPEKKCFNLEEKCKENADCCGGCCKENKCTVFSEVCATDAANPCYFHTCPPGKVCYLATVECLQSPCTPIPACRTDDSDYD